MLPILGMPLTSRSTLERLSKNAGSESSRNRQRGRARGLRGPLHHRRTRNADEPRAKSGSVPRIRIQPLTKGGRASPSPWQPGSHRPWRHPTSRGPPDATAPAQSQDCATTDPLVPSSRHLRTCNISRWHYGQYPAQRNQTDRRSCKLPAANGQRPGGCRTGSACPRHTKIDNVAVAEPLVRFVGSAFGRGSSARRAHPLRHRCVC
jgi:hypothetical protein